MEYKHTFLTLLKLFSKILCHVFIVMLQLCLYSTYSSFHVINVCNQGKTLLSSCTFLYRNRVDKRGLDLYGLILITGTAVAQWLRCCATNRKVAGSIPTGVSVFFVDINSFRSHCGPGVDSASNRNEHEVYLLGVKVAGA